MLLQIEPLIEPLRGDTTKPCEILLGLARIPCGGPWFELRLALDGRVYRMCETCYDRTWIPMKEVV